MLTVGYNCGSVCHHCCEQQGTYFKNPQLHVLESGTRRTTMNQLRQICSPDLQGQKSHSMARNMYRYNPLFTQYSILLNNNIEPMSVRELWNSEVCCFIWSGCRSWWFAGVRYTPWTWGLWFGLEQLLCSTFVTRPSRGISGFTEIDLINSGLMLPLNCRLVAGHLGHGIHERPAAQRLCGLLHILSWTWHCVRMLEDYALILPLRYASIIM